MKHLQIYSTQFQQFITSFQTWLETMGYAHSTSIYLPIHLQEYFYFLENKGLKSIRHIDQQHTDLYFEYLSTRENNKNNGTLSNNYLVKHVQALKLFSRYMREAHDTVLGVKLPSIEQTEPIRQTFTKTEIQALYKAVDNENILGKRDLAMLGIYYGCGLRRSEGTALNVGDVLLHKSLVFVRKSKNGHQRYVPVHEQVKTDLQTYLKARSHLLKDTSQQSFFLTGRGHRIQGQGLALRLKQLTEKARIQKDYGGLHILRHSIATHLLQTGMKLEDIARFLGHRTLEATQIYTHLGQNHGL